MTPEYFFEVIIPRNRSVPYTYLQLKIDMLIFAPNPKRHLIKRKYSFSLDLRDMAFYADLILMKFRQKVVGVFFFKCFIHYYNGRYRSAFRAAKSLAWRWKFYRHLI